MVGTDIHCSYKITKAPDLLEPKDEIEGVFTIENRGKKDKKLKKAFIEIKEIYDERIETKNQETGEITKNYVSRVKELKQFDLIKGEKLKEGEKIDIDFKIQMPGSWSKKKKNKIKHWHMALYFNQKTAMVASRGSDKDDATCILPVKGSKMKPTFGKLPEKEKKEKKEKSVEKKKD